MHVVPALLYTFAIFYGGLSTPPNVPAPQLSQQDKLLHALAFGFMQLVVLRAVRFQAKSWPFQRQNVLAFVLVAGAGGLLELFQLMTSNRSAEVLDFVADALGAGIVAWALEHWMRRRGEETCAPPREPER